MDPRGRGLRDGSGFKSRRNTEKKKKKKKQEKLNAAGAVVSGHGGRDPWPGDHAAALPAATAPALGVAVPSGKVSVRTRPRSRDQPMSARRTKDKENGGPAARRRPRPRAGLHLGFWARSRFPRAPAGKAQGRASPPASRFRLPGGPVLLSQDRDLYCQTQRPAQVAGTKSALRQGLTVKLPPVWSRYLLSNYCPHCQKCPLLKSASSQNPSPRPPPYYSIVKK